jgi:hypothetical protein
LLQYTVQGNERIAPLYSKGDEKNFVLYRTWDGKNVCTVQGRERIAVLYSAGDRKNGCTAQYRA